MLIKTRVKMFLTAVFVCALSFGATAQVITVQQSGDVIIRNGNVKTTLNNNYGDLVLDADHAGPSYGYLWANSAYISGSITVSGNKYFIQPHPTDESKVIKYIAIESGEALTLARGTAKTVNGEATVALPEHFSLTTSKNAPLTVILTPKDAPVLLYTKQDSKEKFVAAMKKSDLTAFGDVEFAFQVTGVRDGFEKQDVIVSVDDLFSRTQDKGAGQNEVRKRINALNEKVKKITMVPDEDIELKKEN